MINGSSSDEPNADVFEFGESTILQLRSQPFRVGDQLGTVMSVPVPEPEASFEETRMIAAQPQPQETASPVLEIASADPLVRLEEKLDQALRQIAALQQRLESIDSTVAKMLMR